MRKTVLVLAGDESGFFKFKNSISSGQRIFEWGIGGSALRRWLYGDDLIGR